MRVTNDKKDNVIRIRLNDTLMKHTYKRSNSLNITVSQYIRDLIVKDMQNK